MFNYCKKYDIQVPIEIKVDKNSSSGTSIKVNEEGMKKIVKDYENSVCTERSCTVKCNLYQQKNTDNESFWL
jgi:hypothetical protein